MLCDWLAKLVPLSQPITEKQRQNPSCLARTRFPALGAGNMYLLRLLIGSLHCLLHRKAVPTGSTGSGFNSTENRFSVLSDLF